MHQLVLRRPQPGVTRRRAPASPVDQGLGMLDAHAHGEGLGLHGHALAVQPGEGVAGAVAHRQHHGRDRDPAAIGQHHGAHRPAPRLQLQSAHPAAERHLAAEGLDAGAQPPHHGGQLERTDMGTVQGEDLRTGAGIHQFFQHLAHVGAGLTHLAVELAVREGAGTTLPELGVGFRIERALPAPEAERVGRALLHRLAPLQQQGPQPHLGQQQGGEIAAGAGTHHHRPGALPVGRGCHRPVALIRGGAQVGIPLEALQQARLGCRREGQLQVEAVNQPDRPLPAGIDAALHQPLAAQLLGPQAQAAADRRSELGVAVVEGKLELAQAQHGSPPRQQVAVEQRRGIFISAGLSAGRALPG